MLRKTEAKIYPQVYKSVGENYEQIYIYHVKRKNEVER